MKKIPKKLRSTILELAFYKIMHPRKQKFVLTRKQIEKIIDEVVDLANKVNNIKND